MVLSAQRSILIIAVCAICTFALRALPFILFGNRSVPPVIRYLGNILPMAVMMTLVVYCIRNISFTTLSGFLPQIISIAVVVLLHVWKSNTFISIVCGTVCYMLLIQFVF